MKIKEQYKVREMAGEHVVIMQGQAGGEMTRIVSLNSTSLYLWQSLSGREFDAGTAARLLVERYDVDARRTLGESFLQPLGHAADDADHQSGTEFAVTFHLGQPAPDALLGVVADRAGV